jgi:GMP synthase-like glutamine amidotransferase
VVTRARIGLLACDHVDARFRDVTDDYDALFATLLPDVELVSYDVIEGQLPESAHECDGWLATGSRHSVYEDLAWIGAASEFVRDVRATDVPFVGVCFGHQLLAHALGGTVERHPGGWGAGIQRLDIVQAEQWMDPAASACRLHFMHQDQVTQAPADAVVLGRADHCEVAMFRVGDTMLGVQAHPEFTVAYAEALLTDRTERIGGDQAAAAIASLTTPTDEAIVARWVARFLTS